MAGKTKSKLFRVGLEGATTDGRTIQRSWLEQAAKNYDQAKYAARVNMEHLRSVYPDSAFRMYGDVLSLKTEEQADGKLALLAEIEPTADLVTMNKARQKLFTSMELDLDFAGTGEAYLVGLAVTVSPASLGTEMLQFSASANANPLASRKLRPENLFTEAMEADLEFIEQPEEKPGLFARVKELLTREKTDTRANFADVNRAVEELATAVVANQDQLEQATGEMDGHIKAMTEDAEQAKAELAGLRQELTELKTKLETTPSGQPRTPATGGNAQVLTDC